jgi:hypothetical protein
MRRCLIWFLILSGMPITAQALDCIPSEPPRISLERVEAPIVYDFQKNRTALNQIGAKLLAASNNGTAHVGGLTNGTIASNMSTQLQTMTAPNGMACIWVSDVQIKLQYDPIVYVSREFAPGTCYHAAVLEHEHKHVAVDRALLNMFAPELQRAIQDVVQTEARRGPMYKSQLDSASREIQTLVETRLNKMMDNLSTVRQARQAQIDTPQEYIRVQNLCVDWP